MQQMKKTIPSMPCFGHDDDINLPAAVTANTKGRVDGHVLTQLLMHYTDTLYPDAKDEMGKHVIFKIDGRPGQFDLSSLVEL